MLKITCVNDNIYIYIYIYNNTYISTVVKSVDKFTNNNNKLMLKIKCVNNNKTNIY